MLKTSVIVPVYNERDYLERNLEALLKQTKPIDQIIVIDNNSSDGSVQSARKKFKTVTFLEEKQQGLVFARNTGFAACDGDILIKIDGDTITDPLWHETLVNDFEARKCDAWTGYVMTSELNSLGRPVVGLLNLLSHRINPVFLGCDTVLGTNMAMTKESWEAIKPELYMRNDIFEDVDISIELSNKNKTIYTQKKKLVHVSARSANATPRQFWRRTRGLNRQLHARKMHARAFAIGALELFVFLTWLVARPLTFFGKKVNERPNPDQN